MPAAKDPTVLMSKVVVDEPEGYRGRRRHILFPFTRKAGGAALPALLVAASIVVVLIVVGVSQLLPKQAAGQIPANGGSGNGPVIDDNGQPVDPDNPGSPSESGSGKPSKSPSPKASGSTSPGATPPAALPTTTNPTTTAPPPTFNAVSMQAETAALAGGAYSSTNGCTSCLSGAKVRNVGRVSATVNGSVSFAVTVPADGNFKITISYEVSGSRDLLVDVNGGSTKTLKLSGSSWGSPAGTVVVVALKSGRNTIRFYNSNAAGPDLDAFKIEQA